MLLRLLAGLVLLGATACASLPHNEADRSKEKAWAVLVENNSDAMVRIYAIRYGTQWRLGMVPPRHVTAFNQSCRHYHGGGTGFVIEPLSGVSAYRNFYIDGTPVSCDQQLRLVIPEVGPLYATLWVMRLP